MRYKVIDITLTTPYQFNTPHTTLNICRHFLILLVMNDMSALVVFLALIVGVVGYTTVSD